MPSSRSKMVLGSIAVLALAIAAYVTLSSGEELAAPGETLRVTGVCLACQAAVDQQYPRRAHTPYHCDACGEDAVYPWLFCHDCKKRVVPRLADDRDGVPRIPLNPTCPACGGPSLMQWLSEEPMHEAVEDAPLPAWR